MTTLPIFEIRLNQDQVPLYEDEKSSQLLELAKLEDWEDDVGW